MLRLDDADLRGKDEDPLRRVSRRVDCCGGGELAAAARASSNGSAVSPSKNLAMAI